MGLQIVKLPQLKTFLEQLKGIFAGKEQVEAIEQAGYQTASQVESAITEKGYQTSEQVESAITGKGYQTAAQVAEAISGAGHLSEGDVTELSEEDIDEILNG